MREAEACYRRGVEVYQALYAANPENVVLGAGLATALTNLGNLLSAVGQAREAEACYRRGVEVYQALDAANPENVGLGNGLAWTLHNLGYLLAAVGQRGEAEACHRCELEVYQALYAANPENIQTILGYAASLCNFRRWEEAEQLVDEILALIPQHPDANRLMQAIRSHRPDPDEE